MAQFNRRHSSVLDDSYKLAIRTKVCIGSSIKERIAALEGSQSVAAKTTRGSHTLSPVFERRSAATFTQNVKPSSLTAQSFKPAETQTNNDFSGSSHPKNVVIKSAWKANTNDSCKTSAPLVSAKPAWVKPQSTILSLAQQDSVSKVERLTDGRVENIISGKPPRPPVKLKPNIRTCGIQNQAQRESNDLHVQKRILPDVLSLGDPPPKPSRPPSVDIYRFRRNFRDGPWMKVPLPVTPPPSRLCPSSNHAAALSQELDMDGGYDDIGILNHPSLPSEDHPSKTTEADLSDENMYEELDDRWREQAEKLKKCQESISGNEDTNQVTEEKQAELKGTINSKEMKAKDIKAKEEEKKQLKQQKAKKKKAQKEKKKFKINKKGKTNKDFKGETSDLNQDEFVEVTHITDDYANTESVRTGHGDLKEVEKEYGWSDAECEVYDDIGEPADVCSGLNVQNLKEEGAYDNLGNPDSSVSPLPQASSGEDDIYDDVDSQKPPLPSDGDDISDDFKKDCIYENTTEEH